MCVSIEEAEARYPLERHRVDDIDLAVFQSLFTFRRHFRAAARLKPCCFERYADFIPSAASRTQLDIFLPGASTATTSWSALATDFAVYSWPSARLRSLPAATREQ